MPRSTHLDSIDVNDSLSRGRSMLKLNDVNATRQRNLPGAHQVLLNQIHTRLTQNAALRLESRENVQSRAIYARSSFFFLFFTFWYLKCEESS